MAGLVIALVGFEGDFMLNRNCFSGKPAVRLSTGAYFSRIKNINKSETPFNTNTDHPRASRQIAGAASLAPSGNFTG